jgi:spermidine synthase
VRPGTVRAEVDQGVAELVPDPDRPGARTLVVNGVEQSHVDPDDPAHLEFEYVRWLGHVVDVAAPAGTPLAVLHLGGGAWTLARYVAATRPRSRQRVVEIDGALVDFVREHLPPPRGGFRVRTGEARQVLSGLRGESAGLIVVDAFAGGRVPGHLTSVEFVADAARVLREGGCYAVNIADGPPLAFARAQAATLAAVFRHTLLIASPQVLRGRRFGNIVLVGSRWELPVVELTRRMAGEAFPARVVGTTEVVRFAGGARPVRDADAAPSPLPPSGAVGAAAGMGVVRVLDAEVGIRRAASS